MMSRHLTAIVVLLALAFTGCGGTRTASVAPPVQSLCVPSLGLGAGTACTPDGAKPASPPVSLPRSIEGAPKHISVRGLHLLEGFEGFSSCPYRDSVGTGHPYTRGYGETEGIRSDSPCISRTYGERNLRLRVERYYEWALRALGVEFNQNEWDALDSFLWNLGAGILTGRLRYDLQHERSPRRAAAAIMRQYVHAGGQVLAGLVTRRRLETDLMLTPEEKPKPVSRADMLARRRALRRVLLRYGCRARAARSEKLGPKCHRWFTEGAAVNRKLRATSVRLASVSGPVEVRNLQVTVSAGTASLAWELSNATNVLGILVEQQAAGGAWVKLPMLAATARTTTITGLQGDVAIRVWTVVKTGVQSVHVTVPPVAVFTPGVVSGSNAADVKAAVILGAKIVRVEVAFSNLAAAGHVIEEYAAVGIRTQLLLGAHAGMPSPEQVWAIRALALKYGPASGFGLPIRLLEFMNETSYAGQYGDTPQSASYRQRARTYAVRAKEGAQALKGTSVGLLAQADDGGSGSSTFVDEEFAAVPDLARYVAGWTLHPYPGGKTAAEADAYGLPKLDLTVATLAKHGDTTLPLDVTEWGVPTDNGRVFSTGQRATFQEAADIVKEEIPKLRAAAHGRIRSFFVFQDRDQQPPGRTTNRENYFGALTTELGTKGAYTTAIKNLLASQ